MQKEDEVIEVFKLPEEGLFERSEKVAIIYDKADMDGECSAMVIRYLLHCWVSSAEEEAEREKRMSLPVEFFPYRYMDPIMPKNFSGATVFIVDVAPPESILKKLHLYARDLIWIDHHDSRMKASSQMNRIIDGVRNVSKNRASCQLAWDFGHALGFFREEESFVVRMLGLYDTWQHNKAYNVVEFQYGARGYFGKHKRKDQFNGEIVPDFWEWKDFICPISEVHSVRSLFVQQKIHEITEDGRFVRTFIEESDRKLARSIAYEAIMLEEDGTPRTVLFANAAHKNSLFFDSVKRPEHEILCLFHLQKMSLWKVTLYANCESVNIGKICESFGRKYQTSGGGRKSVGGFHSPFLPTDPDVGFLDLMLDV